MYLVAIAMIVIAVGILISATGDVSSYANFDDASKANSQVKVIGELSKDKEIIYDPQIDPNFFSFTMKDNAGVESIVVSRQPKPMDFERSESVVVTGTFNPDGEFVASDILTKCPSKYTDEELNLRTS